MFKVECPGCQAPYQVDERRVPPRGLKMRCPKCGTSFQVEPPAPDPRGTSPSPVLGASGRGGKLPLPAAKPKAATMLGVAPGGAPPVPSAPGVKPPIPKRKASPSDADLPALAAPVRVTPPEDDFSDLDLPATRDPLSGVDFPSPEPPGPSSHGRRDSSRFDDLDLPSPVRDGGLSIDLPSRSPRDVDLPSPGRSLDLTSPADGLDLPSPADSLDLDLPSPADSLDLDLPSPADSLDLPSLGGSLDLPSPADSLDLPSLGGSLDLPSLGRGADLPAPGGRAGSQGAPGRFTDLPAARGEGGSGGAAFGELDLPMMGAELPSAGALAPSVADRGSGGADRLSDPFGVPGLDADAEVDPFAGGFDGAGAPLSASGEDVRGAAVLTGALTDDPFAAGGVARQSGGGGVDYGEVSLEAGGDAALGLDAPGGEADLGGVSDEMEFGDLPAEPARGSRAEERQAAGAVAELQARQRRGRLRIALAGVFVVTVAGGALTTLPRVGPFGAYYLYDRIKQGDHERALGELVQTGHQRLGADTYPSARQLLGEAEHASRAAPRFRPLNAYAAFAGLIRILRFGQESEVHAGAKVRLDELGDATGAEIDLARATLAAVDGQLARARELLKRVTAERPTDVDAAIVAAEVELKARDPAAALQAWTRAAELERSARTSFGLARVAQAAADRKAAGERATETLALNPHHVGARILKAEILWSSRAEEEVVVKLLEEVTRDRTAASSEEIVQASTLLGETHLARGRITHAEEAFEEALKLNPKAARALAGFGDALYRAGRYSQALARFKAATQADPDDLSAKLGIAKTSLQLERLEEARGVLEKIRKTHPADMRVAYWLGRVVESMGDRTEAEAAYREAIEHGKDDPESVHAYVALAAIQSQAGLLDAAAQTLTAAQERLPSSPAIHKELGRVAMSQGRYPDALREFETALELDAEDIDSRFLLGNALTRLRQYERALEIYDAIGKVDRDYPGLALERGVLFQESGRQEEALKEYESALAKAPNDADLMLKVGCGKAAAGAGTEAEDILRKVLSQRPNSAETHHCLGRALFAKGNLSDALTSAKRAVQFDANRAVYHLYVGWIASESGSLGEAARSLEKALELDQGLAEAYWQRGVLSYRRTRPKDAIADLLKALELRPSLHEAHADLAMAYRDLGMETMSLAEWEKAITAKPAEASWRFRYGKMLNLNLRHAEAVQHLEKAIELASAGRPESWVPEAHRLLALSLGTNPRAAEHWQAYLKLSPSDAPFRAEAAEALRRMGKPWEE
jgi:cellulose synthase operon protein C